MKNLIKAEKLIRKAFLSDDPVYKLTCELFLWHFESIDSIEGTSHGKTIYFLYKSKNTRLPKQGIANEIYTNVKSLKIVREKYVSYFFHFYDFVKGKGITAESAIALLR